MEGLPRERLEVLVVDVGAGLNPLERDGLADERQRQPESKAPPRSADGAPDKEQREADRGGQAEESGRGSLGVPEPRIRQRPRQDRQGAEPEREPAGLHRDAPIPEEIEVPPALDEVQGEDVHGKVHDFLQKPLGIPHGESQPDLGHAAPDVFEESPGRLQKER